VFVSRSQDLMLRVFSAYLDVLFASDQLTLITAQRDTLLEQRRLNDRLFSKGEGTRTDMLETQAKLDVAEAQVIEARDNFNNTKDVLSGIVGVPVNGVDGLGKEFSVKPLQPASYDAWQTMASEKNPELLAQKYSVDAAIAEIARNRAGHAPRLDFVASYSKGQSESINNYNSDNIVRSIGVQLNIPLYSGGYVSAASSQSVANAERAKADLDARRDRIMQELRKQFGLVQSSVAKVDALQKAVDSGRLLIQATQQSIKGGIRINLDLLNARQQYYASQRDLAQAKYNYLLSYMRLRLNAGVLDANDMRLLAAYFSGVK
jgi:protease secretion system outer membrane protein